MSLSDAMKIAQANFANTALQTAVVSKNMTNASNPNYSRREAVLVSTSYGATIATTQRVQNDALLKQNLVSISKSVGQDTLLTGLERMKTMLGGSAYELSPSTYLSELWNDLQTFADTPSDLSLAQSVITSATDVANSLNTISGSLQKLRSEADADIAASVSELNRLLSEFKTYNDQVKLATATGGDANDALDQRDKLLGQISSIIGVSTVVRANNDIALYTTNGTVLFETLPRTVTFEPTRSYTAGTVGKAVFIDGVEVPAGTGGNTSASGSLPALLQLRDDIAPRYQAQLDETARGLITLFQESGQPGLFTWMDGGTQATTVPGGLTTGLAAAIRVNPAVLSSQGGDPMKLRDGINANQNTGNEASFSVLLDGYLKGFDANMTFDPAAGIDESTTLLEFSTASVGWLEQQRSAATTARDDKAALLSRTQNALYSASAVSVDEELALLLDLEQSYKASAKLVAAIDEMMTALMNMTG